MRIVGGAHECPGPNGEPQLSRHDVRRNLAAATTACTIVCTVLGGALISGNSTQAAQPAPVQQVAAADHLHFPDRLAEFRGAYRGIHQATPVAPVAPVAPDPASPAAASGAAPVAESGRVATTGRASRSSRTTTTRGRAAAGTGRPATSRPRNTRPPSDRPSPRPRTRRTSATPNGAGYSGGVVGFALAQVGKDYVFGSTGPNAYDCSGLVVAAYRNLGISLPRSTGGLAGVGRPVSRSELQPGDLIFPSTGHVGIYIGGGRMVHASTERDGVKVSDIYAFRFARRVMN